MKKMMIELDGRPVRMESATTIDGGAFFTSPAFRDHR